MHTLKAQRILVVDDESDVTELLKYKLEQEGYRCQALNDPLLFASTARDFEPEIMILDIMMPVLLQTTQHRHYDS